MLLINQGKALNFYSGVVWLGLFLGGPRAFFGGEADDGELASAVFHDRAKSTISKTGSKHPGCDLYVIYSYIVQRAGSSGVRDRPRNEI